MKHAALAALALLAACARPAPVAIHQPAPLPAWAVHSNATIAAEHAARASAPLAPPPLIGSGTRSITPNFATGGWTVY